MDIGNELLDLFKTNGIIDLYESNKIIFAISTIGLIIGKDKLLEIATKYDSERENNFEDEILSLLSDETEKEIVYTVLKYIPKTLEQDALKLIISRVVTDVDLPRIIYSFGMFGLDIEHKYGEYAISDMFHINMLVTEIFKNHGGKSIYNIDCGSGSFILSMLNLGYAEKAIGVTRNNDDGEIAYVRNYFLHKDIQIIIKSNSFFFPALQDDEKVDMVYCTYPLIYKYEKEEVFPMIDSWDFNFSFNKRYSANLLWMINALQSIKDDGIVVAFVANGVLFNGIDEEVRKYLVSNNYIDTIITLPNGILPYTGVASSLVILKKNRGDYRTLRMIDASDIYSEQRRYKYFSKENIVQIMDLYSSDNYTDISFNVSLDEVMANDAYLGLNRYCTDTIENAVILDSVTETIFRGYQLNAKELDSLTPDEGEETEYRIINISDIQAEGFVSSDLRSIKADDKKKYDKFLVEDGDIIITAKNTTIKSAIYRSSGEYKAVLSGNLIAIRVNQKKINPYYLKAFMDSESGDLAIKSIQTGTSIITINANSLKDMKISLLSIEEQEIIGNEYKKNLELIIDLAERYKTAASYANQIFKKLRKK